MNEKTIKLIGHKDMFVSETFTRTVHRRDYHALDSLSAVENPRLKIFLSDLLVSHLYTLSLAAVSVFDLTRKC
jgi:hypothetical protein